MNVLVVDVECMNLDFVLRATAHGHAVRWYRWSKREIRDGEGFKGFEVVSEWKPHMEWAKDGLIFVTGNFVHIHELDRWRREFGYQVFGPTVASARLEIDRCYGMETLQAAGVQVPAYKMCDTLQEARKLASKTESPLVFKPAGDTDDKRLTYVSESPEDMCGWLDRQIAAKKDLKGPCMLQEKIADVVAEVGISGWMGPDGFLPDKWNVYFEHKRLMNGDIGPQTGEQGTVCQYVANDKLADELLRPLEPILRSLGHMGDFAMGAMVDKRGKAWPLEFTARSGYPAWYIQIASHRGDPVRWMRDLLSGKDSLRVTQKAALGVVLAQPRYPYNNSPPELVEGNPIRLHTDESDPDLHFVAVMKEREALLTSGEYVMVVTGLGGDVKHAKRAAYATVNTVHFPDMMYRTDIGEALEAKLPVLHEHGYALDVRF